MKSYRPAYPYKKDGSTNMVFFKNKSGVYIIRERTKISGYKIVYIGYSATNLYKTIMRHFQEWSDPRGKRVTYIDKINKPGYNYLVTVSTCVPSLAERLEAYLIKKNKPRDNQEKYEALKLTKQHTEAHDKFKNSEPDAEAVPF